MQVFIDVEEGLNALSILKGGIIPRFGWDLS